MSSNSGFITFRIKLLTSLKVQILDFSTLDIHGDEGDKDVKTSFSFGENLSSIVAFVLTLKIGILCNLLGGLSYN